MKTLLWLSLAKKADLNVFIENVNVLKYNILCFSVDIIRISLAAIFYPFLHDKWKIVSKHIKMK